MNKTFAMWKKSITQLIMMSDKQEFDQLDLISKYFIVTRSAVANVTLYSGLIGGLLAWQYLWLNGKPFDFLTWLIMTLGLFLAHGANNLLNDYTDFSRGVDKDNYFRTQYGVHPLVQNFWDKATQLRWFAVCGILALLAGLYTLVVTNFDTTVLILIAVGAFMLLFYTYPLKHFAVGELSIFIIWGPLMIGGVYYVLTGQWPLEVTLASIPIGLGVASVNVGKHIDKSPEDRVKGIHTMPVVVGETVARWITVVSIVLMYLIVVYLVFVPRFFTPLMLLVFFAVPPARKALERLLKPRPAQPPAGYPIWPRWFSTVCFIHNRVFSNYFVILLVVDTLLRIFLPAFWPVVKGG